MLSFFAPFCSTDVFLFQLRTCLFLGQPAVFSQIWIEVLCHLGCLVNILCTCSFFVPWSKFFISCRRHVLEKKLADAEVSQEEQSNLLKHLEKKETEYMRLQRHKMGADDFEPLTMIGRGAFGEV